MAASNRQTGHAIYGGSRGSAVTANLPKKGNISYRNTKFKLANTADPNIDSDIIIV